MNMDKDICKKCGSVNFLSVDDPYFYLTSCLFCGDFYSEETMIGEDYNLAILKNKAPVIRKKTEGQGAAYFASIGDEPLISKYAKDDYIDYHVTSWDEFDKGVFMRKESESEVWYEDMIKEIKTNSSIDKSKSYVTKWDDDMKELILLYGDELRFLRGSNPLVKESLELSYEIIRNIENKSKDKKDEAIEEIEKITDKIKVKIETQIIKELVEIHNIIQKSEDDEIKSMASFNELTISLGADKYEDYEFEDIDEDDIPF